MLFHYTIKKFTHLGGLKMKSTALTYLLWLPSLFGLAGLHRIYLGKPITGLIWFFTCGLLFFGTIYDLFTIPGKVKVVNMFKSISGIADERKFRDSPARWNWILIAVLALLYIGVIYSSWGFWRSFSDDPVEVAEQYLRDNPSGKCDEIIVPGSNSTISVQGISLALARNVTFICYRNCEDDAITKVISEKSGKRTGVTISGKREYESSGSCSTQIRSTRTGDFGNFFSFSNETYEYTESDEGGTD